MTLEDHIEQAFWEFDAERKRTGAERDAFKRQMRAIVYEAKLLEAAIHPVAGSMASQR